MLAKMYFDGREVCYIIIILHCIQIPVYIAVIVVIVANACDRHMEMQGQRKREGHRLQRNLHQKFVLFHQQD